MRDETAAPVADKPTNAGVSADAEIVRFLLRAQFSASAADVASVKSLGYVDWLKAQFATAPSLSGYGWLDSKLFFVPTKEGNYFDPTWGDWMAWNQLVTGHDQVRKRLALALSEMFVVSLDAVDGFWPPYVMAGYWDMLSNNVFGNFRTLLEDVTLNAAMGLYLNTRDNKREDPGTGREPDENYAREVMQLFTIGLYELNADGTPKLDAAGRKTETYNQSDISNLAHVFTGYAWDYSNCLYATVPWLSYPVPTPHFARDRMAFHPTLHSGAEVNFLGTNIHGGMEGRAALKIALDTLFNHPNTGPFFCRQMIQRLVTSNPQPAYVERVARVFADNGSGTRGDLKAVWIAILTDEAALAPFDRDHAAIGKLREPMIRWTQWARTFKADSTNGKWAVGNLSGGDWALGQSPLRSPSVFNFFRPGYVPPHTAFAEAELVAPEFQIHNESTTASYINFMSQSIKDGHADIKADYAELMPMAPDAQGLLDWLNLYLSASQVSPKNIELMRSALETKPVRDDSADADKLTRIHTAILLVMASPEYLVQK